MQKYELLINYQIKERLGDSHREPFDYCIIKMRFVVNKPPNEKNFSVNYRKLIKKSPPIVLQKANMITLLKTFMMIAS